MILDAEQLGGTQQHCRGPLIVGSGPVALTLALYLGRKGVPVTVIERGGVHSTVAGSSDLEVDFVEEHLQGAVIARTRQLGGGLNLWGGQLATPLREEWSAIGSEVAGTITFDALNEHLRGVAQLLGQDIALPLSCPLPEHEQTQLEASGLSWLATAWLKSPKLSSELWTELAASDTIKIVCNASVDRLDIDTERSAVTGVSAKLKSGTRLDFSSFHVVIAAGTIETCRLLLLPSGAGTRQPWHDLNWLGRGFNEHLDADTATIHAINLRRLGDTFDPVVRKDTKYSPKLFARSKGEHGDLSAVAMLTFPSHMRNSLAELALLVRTLTPKALRSEAQGFLSAAAGAAREVLPLAVRYLRHKRIGSSYSRACFLRVSVEQPIREDNRITLSSQRTDSLGIPVAQLEWRKGAAEGHAFQDMTYRFKVWAETNNLARVQVAPLLMENSEAFARSASEGLHHAGGARMAACSADGVVDPDLQVFGVEGLYCCGASVLPRSGYANPTFASMGLAVRLGGRLCSKIGAS